MQDAARVSKIKYTNMQDASKVSSPSFADSVSRTVPYFQMPSCRNLRTHFIDTEKECAKVDESLNYRGSR